MLRKSLSTVKKDRFIQKSLMKMMKSILSVSVLVCGLVSGQTDPPSPGFPECLICGTGNVVTNPGAIVQFPGQDPVR